MKITQGTFSFLPDLTDEQIEKQLRYAVDRGWAISIEHTDDPHPRNVYWEMAGPPEFDLKSTDKIMHAIHECRDLFGDRYVKVNAFDSTSGFETVRLSFLVHRPPVEAKYRLVRQESDGRAIRYTVERVGGPA